MNFPFIKDCTLRAIGTGAIGVSVAGRAVLMDNFIDADVYDIQVANTAIVDVSGNAFETSNLVGSGSINPLSGDRAAFDALLNQARHTNDINEAAGIHHTLADLDTHYISTTLTDAHILVGDGSNIATDVAVSRDVSLADTGAATVVGLQGRDVASTAPSDGQALVWNNGASKWTPGNAGHVIEDEGVTLPTEPNLNFTGNLVAATDNSGSSRTDVTIQASLPISVYNETQSADGVSTTYYLINYAAPGTIRVYIDGIRQPASDDTSATDVVTFTTAPDAGALLLFDYEMDLA